MFTLHKKIKRNKGMTYAELIVVLSIFSIMTGIIMFSYGDFQAKVDIKNLTSDIALKIVEAQKSSISGILPPLAQQTLIIDDLSTWKPSYGLYFKSSPDPDSTDSNIPFNKKFIYFADMDQNGIIDNFDCSGNNECLDKILITKGNYISDLEVFYKNGTSTNGLGDLTVTFIRPDSRAIISSSNENLQVGIAMDYAQIDIKSPHSASCDSGEELPCAKVKVFSSGRIEID